MRATFETSDRTPDNPRARGATGPLLDVEELGRVDYRFALELQLRLAARRIRDEVPDRLLLLEHSPVVTLGRSGGPEDLRADEAAFSARGVTLVRTDRGGKATYHGPGQLVAYPILKLAERDLHAFMERMLAVACSVVESYGLRPERSLHGPGVWVGGAKIASLGFAVDKWVTRHGLALNGNVDLSGFTLIHPCGFARERVTSLARELGAQVDMAQVRERFVRAFLKIFGHVRAPARPHAGPDRPEWLRVRVRTGGDGDRPRVERLLDDSRLSTVCQEARCPNMEECFDRGTATFMILGAICTRGCRYCAVTKGRPAPPDPDEPRRVAEAVAALGIRHAVVTSVTRDDLPDGGAAQFARTIRTLRRHCPGVGVEVLAPDFGGCPEALRAVCEARPDVFNHNIETVRRLFPIMRPRADYDLSLDILRRAADRNLLVKSGLMLGLGETDDEIAETLRDLRAAGCAFLTLGQYLAPTRNHAPIDRYLTPAAFERLARTARALGFAGVASGPLVRSSYQAGRMFLAGRGSNAGDRARTPGA